MVISVGIDPGTASFDITVTERGKVIHTESVPSGEITAEMARAIIDRIGEWEPDIVIGPSGYGTPVVCNDEIVNPGVFAEKVLLLSGYIERPPIEYPGVGKEVYLGVYRLATALAGGRLYTCYMPGVIHLTTVPFYKKVNKIDMGTVDKLASAFYVVSELSKGRELTDIDAIIAEVGYGYNAVIEVSGGRITDGHGGSVLGNSFLSIGGLDSEIPSLLGFWSREMNFSGGVATICGSLDPDEVFSSSDERCSLAISAMIDSLAKNIHAIRGSSRKAVFLTGRLSAYERISSELGKRGVHAKVWEKKWGVKEASVGYALLGEGLAEGATHDIFRHMRIKDACGGTLDWVFHPLFRSVKEAFHRAVEESIAKESRYKFSCD